MWIRAFAPRFLLRLVLTAALFPATACGPEDLTASEESIEVEGFGEEVLDPLATCARAPSPLYAIGGKIITSNSAFDGYVLVQDELIIALQRRTTPLPAHAVVVETFGVISPGLIDLHNHVAYNFIPPWTPPKLYQNRYQWQRAVAYDAVKQPYNAIKNGNHLCEAQKYGELRALVGGTTTIQGSIGRTCQNGWARNVEGVNFCEDKVRQWVMAISSMPPTEAAKLVGQFEADTARAFLIHLGEGVDALSRNELDALRSLGLMRKEVAAIHGTAFTPSQLSEMAANQTKLIWSPRSSMVLYGKTANIPAAVAAGVKVAIAADWSPTGSANLLAELRYADRLNKTLYGGLLTDTQLFSMVTTIPARIAGMDAKLGRVAAGFYADLLIVRNNGKGARRSVIEARPEDVLLTTVSGKALYGETSLLDALGQAGKYETVSACGKPRGLVVQDPKVTLGTQKLADLTAAFAADGVTHIAPLIECPAVSGSAVGGSVAVAP